MESSFFTVYQTQSGIELRPGCDDSTAEARLICTCKNYEAAYETAQSIAHTRSLPLIDCVYANPMS
ncbi:MULTISPECIES: hypothetical protein [Trichocoleus]|uniref:Uncharacterized protein n=1 Tax=Trichocoleus desertorum GB2-A4 TaxID=2933944 RepID=A0ABV0J9B4_9CYAN|nr:MULTISPECIES: hypothetical protein [unclassified Trichocoleus]MBD1864599.1 hypothetical protein [Trichocoleus sp. FACHB-46]MBD2094140.1 hypothetical protein [Trichocoleus sp. FACHB-591]MBD2120626.1 hypothetical protein [Trichocoleus sp. FACHB-262]